MKQVHTSSSTSTINPYSPEEAIALIVNLNLDIEYITFQGGAKAKGANIYHSYNAIAYFKKQCYPSNSTETSFRPNDPAFS